MRFSSFHTQLFSLLALLLLSAVACSAQNPEPITSDSELTSIEVVYSEAETLATASAEMKQVPHLELAQSYVGTQELTGANDGPEIEQFLATVNLKAGNPYCAAFVSYILEDSPGVTKPDVRSGLAYHFITDDSIPANQVLRGTTTIPDGTILVWRKGNTIYGHTGFVADHPSANHFETIEANTSSGRYGNQRDGDGVWLRQRSIQPGNYFRITHFTRVVYA